MARDAQPDWHVSSHSNDHGGSCVEVAVTGTPEVAVRDSKDRTRATAYASPAAWTAFLDATTTGNFTNPADDA
ncbi:DUF397 domain-containing protein [Streptomyces avicenniae]|uniref:DUF397 domain-containing protein n=1 Tax=Streptomyces avicenniae TaxID=500153 RepID=UPI000DA620A5|nr:DUF397 domain-containing protein [Streptomyces avicenniae]